MDGGSEAAAPPRTFELKDGWNPSLGANIWLRVGREDVSQGLAHIAACVYLFLSEIKMCLQIAGGCRCHSSGEECSWVKT